MGYTYEAIVKREVDDHYDGYSVIFPDWEEATCGTTPEEAARAAQDLLWTLVSSAISDGDPLPIATFGNDADGGNLAWVTVDVTPEEASDWWGWITTKEAADILGVTPHRVRIMANTDVLPSKRTGRDILVQRGAVEERLKKRGKQKAVQAQ